MTLLLLFLTCWVRRQFMIQIRCIFCVYIGKWRIIIVVLSQTLNLINSRLFQQSMGYFVILGSCHSTPLHSRAIFLHCLLLFLPTLCMNKNNYWGLIRDFMMTRERCYSMACISHLHESHITVAYIVCWSKVWNFLFVFFISILRLVVLI